MKTEVKELDVSTSVEVTVGPDYKPIKVRAFSSKKLEVTPEPGDKPSDYKNAVLKEQRDQFQVCWRSVVEQTQGQVNGPAPPKD